MILVDTGPLVPLLNARDQDHATCVQLARSLPDTRIITTWPCFTEAIYLLYRDGGLAFQEALWDFRASGILNIHTPSAPERNPHAAVDGSICGLTNGPRR